MKFKELFKRSFYDGGFFSRCKKYIFHTPDALPWGVWEKWDNKQKAKRPILWFLLDTIPSFIRHKWRPIKDARYNLKCKYWKKYHHIKIDVDRFFVFYGEKTKNPYHWIDSDTQILYANFQILVNFVEDESETTDWQSDPKHQEIYDEFMEIYKWWTEKRPNRADPFPDLEDYDLETDDIFGNKRETPGYKQWSKDTNAGRVIEEEHENEDTEMLIRLITIRRYLWS